MEVEEAMVVEKASDCNSSKVAFLCALAVPILLGSGSLTFFSLPEEAPVLVTLLVGGVFIVGAYLSFLRYEFEVVRLNQEVETKSAHSYGTFRLATVLAVASRGGFARGLIAAGMLFAMVVFAAGAAYALSQALYL